jgi:hypothetical protein
LKTIQQEGVAKGIKRLKRLKLLSLPETLLGSVQSFSLGTSYPYYSRYTLRNVPVTGLHAELQPGLLQLAFTASKNLSAIPGQPDLRPPVERGEHRDWAEGGKPFLLQLPARDG